MIQTLLPVIAGSEACTSFRKLRQDWRDDIERGNRNTYVIHDKIVGDLLSVKVSLMYKDKVVILYNFLVSLMYKDKVVIFNNYYLTITVSCTLVAVGTNHDVRGSTFTRPLIPAGHDS